MEYYKIQNAKKEKKLQRLLCDLPDFHKQFFRGIEFTSSVNTRISYAYNIRTFLTYLIQELPEYKDRLITTISPDEMNDITTDEIENYRQYLKLYQKGNRTYINQERGIARNLSALRSFYHFFVKRQIFSNSPFVFVDMPKLHTKPIIYLNDKEIPKLLQSIREYASDSEHQNKYFDKTRRRDLAIISLLAGTGIRVSECVGLNLGDINQIETSIHITRKGGNESIIYYGKTVKATLADYIENERSPLPSEDALFLSLKKGRLCVRQIQRIVEKYTHDVIPYKNITPHKLRSSFGTILYQKSRDIYMVAEVLGHKDISTTKKHYAAIGEEQKREASKLMDDLEFK